MKNTLIERDFYAAKLSSREGWIITDPLYTGSTSPINSYSSTTDIFGGIN